MVAVATVRAGAVLALLLAAFLAYAYGCGGLRHRGRRVDVWVFPRSGADAVATNARSVMPVVYRRVWRVGPVVLAWLSPIARDGEGPP